MKLLLHICCAPCSTAVIERLASDYDVTGFFYNPNIHPAAEYRQRLGEMRRYSLEVGFDFIEGRYESDRWFELAQGLEHEPEGGERCRVCYRMRLEETAKAAREGGFDIFTTTLSISPHKNAEAINSIGLELGERYDISFLSADFKKKDGFKESVLASKKHRLIRQNYCGCIYSKRDREGT